MKKVFRILFFIVIIFLGYYIYKSNDITKILKDVEEEKFIINDYSIFGTHFNISGCIDSKLSKNSILVLKNNKEEIELKSIFETKENTCFKVSNKLNDSIYLDKLKKGHYLLLVKDKDENKYYTLENNMIDSMEYYTILTNNKIDININSNYLDFEIIKSEKPNDVYDITIDPGHGGNDIGSSYTLNGKTYYESNFTLKVALLLKDELEDLGLKVKLTRDKDVFLDNYGEYGRASIPNKVKSKYSISIHLNSTEGNMTYGGVEVYTPNDVDYTFAQYLADNLSEVVGYSKKPSDKVSKGVYYTYFTEDDILDSKKEMTDKKMKSYDIKVGAPYMFMIREVGGINTYAYVDGRNEKYGLNEYYNSNQTAEPYLIELGYINYKDDLNKFINTPESFSKSILKSIKKYLDIS